MAIFYSFLNIVSLITTLNVSQDFAVADHVEEFIRLSGDPIVKFKTRNIEIRFVEKLDGITAGKCISYGKIGTLIEISEEQWEKMTELQQKALVFHELGHCVLNRDHTTTFFPQSVCPTSLMSYSVEPDKCLRKYWQYYLRELFGR
ncbi:MAG: putative metallopeptidase [Candidatus Thorarchaeota archaeon]